MIRYEANIPTFDLLHNTGVNGNLKKLEFTRRVYNVYILMLANLSLVSRFLSKYFSSFGEIIRRFFEVN